MKKVIILFMLIPLSFSGFADEKKVESKISDVTVYLSGAEVTRKAETTLTKGTAELVFIELPVSLDPKSVQVHVPEDVKILSVLHRIKNNEADTKFPERKMLKKEIDKRRFEIEKIDAYISVYDQKKKLLLGNSGFSGAESGVNLEELKQAAVYFSQQLEDIEMKKLNFERQKSALNHEIDSIQKQISRLLNIKPEPTGEVVIKVDSKTAGNKMITIKYFVGAAGWAPTYDIRVKDVDRPLVLSVKADVHQSTGEDWKDVKLTLATDNPNKDNRKPELPVWYLSYYNPYSRQVNYKLYDESNAGAIKGKVIDNETGEPLPFANIILEDGRTQVAGTASDFDGNYTIKPVPPGNYNLKATYIGYKTSLIDNLKINSGQITFFNIGMQASSETLEEVVITDYKVPLIDKDNTVSGGTVTSEEIRKMPSRSSDGNTSYVRGARSAETAMYIDGIRVLGNASVPKVVINQHKISNVKYEIENPYTIPSDGDNYTVSVKDYEADAIYEYYCIPKLNEDVFLLARVTGWEDMNLLPGKSNIFFKGTYTGKTFINPDITEDTLDLSIGRDKGIVITRKRIKDFKNRQTIGSNIKESVGFEISVRNTKNSKISITIADQFPLSRTKDISIDRIEYSGGELNEDTGRVTWEMTIASRKTEKRELKYMVKYPKGKTIAIE